MSLETVHKLNVRSCTKRQIAGLAFARWATVTSSYYHYFVQFTSDVAPCLNQPDGLSMYIEITILALAIYRCRQYRNIRDIDIFLGNINLNDQSCIPSRKLGSKCFKFFIKFVSTLLPLKTMTTFLNLYFFQRQILKKANLLTHMWHYCLFLSQERTWQIRRSQKLDKMHILDLQANLKNEVQTKEVISKELSWTKAQQVALEKWATDSFLHTQTHTHAAFKFVQASICNI